MKQFLVAILFSYTSTIFAGSLTFKTDSTSYLIGEQALFTLEYNGEPNITWHNLNDTLTKDIEIIALGKIDTLSPGNYRQRMLLTAWDSGYFVVPPIFIGNAQSAPLLLRFNSVEVDLQSEFKGNKDQLNTPLTFEEIVGYFIAILLFYLFIVGGFFVGRYFYMKNKKPVKLQNAAPSRPVIEILWERYHSLAESKIWETGKEKDFHVELSLILRKFLEFRYKIKALEETTGNINKQLESLGIDRGLKDEISHILNFSDMVKFAKQRGVYTQHENALNILEKILKTHQENVE